MPCILHARGADFQIDRFLRTTSLKVFRAWRRGGVYGQAGESFPDSGFSVEVSPADFADPDQQIADAEAFLSAHRSELKRLWRQTGIEGANLDFGFLARISPDVRSFWDAFPHTLLKLCGDLKIDLEISYYPHPDVDYRWYEEPREAKRPASRKPRRSPGDESVVWTREDLCAPFWSSRQVSEKNADVLAPSRRDEGNVARHFSGGSIRPETKAVPEGRRKRPHHAMAHTYTSCLIHAVFATAGRRPWLTDEVRDRLHAYIGGIGRDLGFVVRRVGGPDDHVHVLLALTASVPIAKAMQTIKGSSPDDVSGRIAGIFATAWASGVGARP